MSNIKRFHLCDHKIKKVQCTCGKICEIIKVKDLTTGTDGYLFVCLGSGCQDWHFFDTDYFRLMLTLFSVRKVPIFDNE